MADVITMFFENGLIIAAINRKTTSPFQRNISMNGIVFS
jgi:hypothetical protein